MAFVRCTSSCKWIKLCKSSFISRFYSTVTEKKGLVLGVYLNEDKSDDNGACMEDLLTPEAKKFNKLTCGNLVEHLKLAGPNIASGKVRVLYNLNQEFPAVAVVGLGKEQEGFNELEEVDEKKEAIRAAAAAGCRSLRDVGVTKMSVETLGNAESAAEGATLGLWLYQELKNKKKQKPACEISQHGNDDESGWQIGLKKADAQNLARRLTDTPANLMTPTIFSQNAVNVLTPLGVDVIVRDKAWAEQMKMGSFLSVTRGSSEPPAFLELSYSGGGSKDDKPIVFVGKGVTFDSGGISLKPSGAMDEMRGDMGGAACVVATIYAVASLKLNINIKGLIPLCENMPSGTATKPGDVVTAMNGKTIAVDNTDAEGRLILADALCYAEQFNPLFTLDIATLTGAIRVALGGSATGVFSNSTTLWNELQKAGSETGDRVWRLPLWKYYTSQVADLPSVDVNNVGKGKGGGSCTAAAFLKEFAPKGDWLHLDIAGVMGPSQTHPYLGAGMTGRPTRTLIEFIRRQVK